MMSWRHQASPATGLALMQVIGQLVVRHVLSAVTAPTLVLHRQANAWWSIDGARWMTDRLPNGQLIELPGSDNYWWAGDARWRTLLDAHDRATITEAERFGGRVRKNLGDGYLLTFEDRGTHDFGGLPQSGDVYVVT